MTFSVCIRLLATSGTGFWVNCRTMLVGCGRILPRDSFRFTVRRFLTWCLVSWTTALLYLKGGWTVCCCHTMKAARMITAACSTRLVPQLGR